MKMNPENEKRKYVTYSKSFVHETFVLFDNQKRKGGNRSLLLSPFNDSTIKNQKLKKCCETDWNYIYKIEFRGQILWNQLAIIL